MWPSCWRNKGGPAPGKEVKPMGKGIKTRVSEKKGIKAIDKAAVASEQDRSKEAYIRTKDKADTSLCYAEEGSPGEYASDRLSAGVDNVTHEAVHQFDKQGRKGGSNDQGEHLQGQGENPEAESRSRTAEKNKRLGRLGSPPHAGVAVRQRIRFPSRPRRSVRSAGPSRPWTAARKALRQWTGAAKPSSRLLPQPRGR